MDKFLGKVTGGVSLCEAVEDRYGAVEGETAGVDKEMLGNLCKEIGAPFVTVVGFDKVNQKQSNFAKLLTVSARKSKVSTLSGASKTVGQLIPRVRNLDLSENLLSSWDQLVEVGKQLRELRVLTANCNRLTVRDSIQDDLRAAFPKLEQLVIGDLDYDWSQVFLVASAMPNLLLLNCHENRISSIERIDSKIAFTNLQELNLNGNPLKDWGNVLKFSGLPNLRTLFINNCQLESIYFDETNEQEEVFPNLRCLCMTYNKIDDWLSFAKLDLLKITDLRCRNNPIIEREKNDTSRQILIATIGSLMNLNGTHIERTERYGADVDYLKRHGLEYIEALKTNNLAEFERKYPRYNELVQKYGAIDEHELVKKDTSLKASLISVTIDCPEVVGLAKMTKKLPPTMTIQKLRLLLQRAINRKSEGAFSHKFVMSAANAKKPDVVVPLDNDMRDLFFYSVEDGDTIFVKW